MSSFTMADFQQPQPYDLTNADNYQAIAGGSQEEVEMEPDDQTIIDTLIAQHAQFMAQTDAFQQKSADSSRQNRMIHERAYRAG